MKKELLKLLKEYKMHRDIEGGAFNLNDFYEWLADEVLEEELDN